MCLFVSILLLSFGFGGFELEIRNRLEHVLDFDVANTNCKRHVFVIISGVVFNNVFNKRDVLLL